MGFHIPSMHYPFSVGYFNILLNSLPYKFVFDYNYYPKRLTITNNNTVSLPDLPLQYAALMASAAVKLPSA